MTSGCALCRLRPSLPAVASCLREKLPVGTHLFGSMQRLTSCSCRCTEFDAKKLFSTHERAALGLARALERSPVASTSRPITGQILFVLHSSSAASLIIGTSQDRIKCFLSFCAAASCTHRVARFVRWPLVLPAMFFFSFLFITLHYK